MRKEYEKMRSILHNKSIIEENRMIADQNVLDLRATFDSISSPTKHISVCDIFNGSELNQMTIVDATEETSQIVNDSSLLQSAPILASLKKKKVVITLC